MLKLIISLVFLTGIIEANSQSLVVKSFRWINPELKTETPKPTNELKTNKYAIIKIESKLEGLTFSFNNSGKELASLRQTGDLWLWVPSGVQKVEIFSPLTGEKLTYPFGGLLGKKDLYIMALDVDKATPPTKDKKVEVKWFSIFTIPLGVKLSIDSLQVGVTPFTGSLTMGTHNLELNYEGKVRKQEIKVNKDFAPVIYMSFTVTPIQKNPDSAYFASDDAAQFPGGTKMLMKFLKEKIRYPINALQNGVQGTVYVQFKVNETGKISDIKVLRAIGGGCDEEAVRVVKRMPTWKPAQFEGKPVPCLFTLPVKFNTQIMNMSNALF
jgi:TonB family protein